MRKIDRLRSEIGIILKEIENLQTFRQTAQTKKFLRQLIGERMTLQNKIKNLEKSKKIKDDEKQKRRTEANKKRSQKNKRAWNFIKSIQKNYDTGKTTQELRSEFSKFKKGLETDVSEVIWRNPSP